MACWSSYEAFAQTVDSMPLNCQVARAMPRVSPWRRPLASLNVLPHGVVHGATTTMVSVTGNRVRGNALARRCEVIRV